MKFAKLFNFANNTQLERNCECGIEKNLVQIKDN